jgi:uncharacterized protein YueI
METMIIKGKSRSDLELFLKLASKFRLKAKILSDEEKEDIGLSIAFQKGKTGEFINTDAFVKTLKS